MSAGARAIAARRSGLDAFARRHDRKRFHVCGLAAALGVRLSFPGATIGGAAVKDDDVFAAFQERAGERLIKLRAVAPNDDPVTCHLALFIGRSRRKL